MKLFRRTFLQQSLAGLATAPWLLSSTSSAQDTAMGEAKFVNVNGYKTRYFEAGSGEPMVFIHGGQFGMDGAALGWRPIFGRLAEHYHVYAFDKLGMGETDDPAIDEHWSMKGVIEHADGFIKAMGLNGYHMVGHSRGGLPAARIAVDHPDQVKSLIVFDSNTLAPDDPITPVYYYEELLVKNPPKSPKWPNAIAKMRSLRDRWVDQNAERVKKDPNLAVILGPTPWWIWDIKYETLDMIKAGGLKAPMLLVWGFNDPSAPYQLGVKLYDTVLGPHVKPCRFYIMNECSHSPYGDHPEEALRLMLDFLRNPPSATRAVRS
ncbi:MAG: alpha/beta hydrolase [Acidobacteria bacterium]|nr:alpha/beta hydrolase [Acidobacteriota bacterium]